MDKALLNEWPYINNSYFKNVPRGFTSYGLETRSFSLKGCSSIDCVVCFHRICELTVLSKSFSCMKTSCSEVFQNDGLLVYGGD